MDYVIGHDLGTSTHKAVALAADGTLRAHASAALTTESPQPGWAEQDPHAWWAAVVVTTRALIASGEINPAAVKAVSFSAQMQGTLPVDASGRPLAPAMIWLDQRAGREAQEATRGLIRVAGYGPVRFAKWLYLTGGAPALNGMDPLAKILWLRDNRPEIWAQAHKVLDVKDYLLLRCTGRFVTSYDCGNLTWLMNTRTPGWSKTLLSMVGVPEVKLPELVPCTTVVGGLTPEAANEMGLRPGTPVVAGAGDVCAMTVGVGALREEDVHLAVGTSSWITTHVDGRYLDALGYVASMCSAYPGKNVIVATQQTAGASVQWVCTQLLGRDTSPATYAAFDALVESCEPGAAGLFFAPWMAGERTPIDDRFARAGLWNLSLGHETRHVARAVYEGVALNTRWALGRVERLAGRRASELRFAGGGARSATWCQVLADVLDRDVLQMVEPQLAAARGAAMIAAHAQGWAEDFASLARLAVVARRYRPRPEWRGLYDERYAAFVDLYRRQKGWFRRVNG